MKQTLISYKTKPDRSEENAQLIRAVFDELRKQAPSSLGYLVLRAENGQYFHFVQTDDGASPLNELAAFAAFQNNVRERLLGPPLVRELALVGSYGMLENAS
ncbi:MAG: hypothetical protein V4508_10680 [Pseudomonadota bacterium]